MASMKLNQPKVSIIIINWNGLKDTIECLESLKKITYPNYEVIVVDNGSKGNDAQVLKERFGNYIHLLQNDKNYGFAGGVNVGIEYALSNSTTDYILLLNNDTLVVEPGFLTSLVRVSGSNRNTGFVGAKICYYDDPSKVCSVGGRISMFTGMITSIGNGSPSETFIGVKPADCISGCALLVKGEVIKKVGLLDTKYFFYFEDIDWSLKAHKYGYVHYINCDMEILHKGGASVRKNKNINYYYFTRNKLTFMRKQGNTIQLVTFFPLFTIYLIAQFLLNLVKGQLTRCKYIVLAVKDFIAGKSGEL